MGKNILLTIYSHPEFYPPMLNAIDALSADFSQVDVVARNLIVSKWKYPDNVRLFIIGERDTLTGSMRASFRNKILAFIRFARNLYKRLRAEKYEWIVCNDNIALFAYRLIRPFLKRTPKLWYHSHDVSELRIIRRYSIGYFANKSESTHFDQIDLFTLPSEARIKYYPINKLRGKCLVVPNYPSLYRMAMHPVHHGEPGTTLKMIYQGRVSDEHGLEEFIDFMQTDSGSEMTMIGPGESSYIQKLEKRIERLGVNRQVNIMEPVPYHDLKEITSRHQIGIAVNKPMNILYQTAALASNKIYEYAAAGLPVIYFRDRHYTETLNKYDWAFSSDLSIPDLSGIVHEIRADFDRLSVSARLAFKTELNFEHTFKPVLSFILASSVHIK